MKLEFRRKHLGTIREKKKTMSDGGHSLYSGSLLSNLSNFLSNLLKESDFRDLLHVQKPRFYAGSGAFRVHLTKLTGGLEPATYALRMRRSTN